MTHRRYSESGKNGDKIESKTRAGGLSCLLNRLTEPLDERFYK